MVLWALPALALDGGAADGGDDTPDASAGNGGAQMTQESDDDMTNGTCSLTRDCERGFQCVGGMCKYSGFRQATQGCSAAPGLAMLTAAALVALARRRRRPPR